MPPNGPAPIVVPVAPLPTVTNVPVPTLTKELVPPTLTVIVFPATTGAPVIYRSPPPAPATACVAETPAAIHTASILVIPVGTTYDEPAVYAISTNDGTAAE